MAPPYTYSKLVRYISTLEYPFSKIIVSIENSTKSELGNSIPCLKIASKERPSRKAIFITARQHPCETVGSYVCEHILKLLTNEDELSLQLLRKFTFFVVPMVNTDGVIHGNSRTNLLGYDLNRSW